MQQCCIKNSLRKREANSNTGTEELSKSTCWSDSSYSPGDNTQTYFVEWGEAVTVCALHCHTKLKNQYFTGGRCVMVPDVYSQSKTTASRRRAQARGLEKNTGAEEVLTITPESRQDPVRDGRIRGRDIWRHMHNCTGHKVCWKCLILFSSVQFFLQKNKCKDSPRKSLNIG